MGTVLISIIFTVTIVWCYWFFAADGYMAWFDFLDTVRERRNEKRARKALHK